ncbi:Sterile alpha motif domain-containing 3 [Labeo rohita]|uniref:Sterile alpha motif domain-containing 3 n=1 Tax=Labeo rohita TaxID=84645 RepID=A0A498NQS3_LABRO|nr:Sterile alpha motif domain-containing 3 [Labeo rohita]
MKQKAAADAFTSTEETTVGIYILKSQDRSEDFWIVLEGQKVLQGLDNFALALAMLFGLMYALNLNYPPEMKHTFEVLQKIVMELEGCARSKKAQVLRNRLYE